MLWKLLLLVRYSFLLWNMRFTRYTFCFLQKISHPETESLRGRNCMLWPGCVKIVTTWKIDESENFVTRCEHLFVSKPVHWIGNTFSIFFQVNSYFRDYFQLVTQINNRSRTFLCERCLLQFWRSVLWNTGLIKWFLCLFTFKLYLRHDLLYFILLCFAMREQYEEWIEREYFIRTKKQRCWGQWSDHIVSSAFTLLRGGRLSSPVSGQLEWNIWFHAESSAMGFLLDHSSFITSHVHSNIRAKGLRTSLQGISWPILTLRYAHSWFSIYVKGR